MKTRSLVAVAAVALAVLIAAPFAFAQHHEMRGHGEAFGGPAMFRHLEHAKKALNLSDEQVAQIQSIFADLRTQNAPYRESIHTGFGSAFQALIANPNDVAGAQRALDQQAAAEHAMKSNALTAFSKALNVLTPDQRAKLATIVQERMAHRAAR